jgi:hypothetical protein
MQSPAASDSQRRYLPQWRDAASPWSRAWKYVSETASAIVNTITGAPLSTLIAGSIALVLAAALIVVLLVMYRQPRHAPEPAREPELEPEPAPAALSPPPPHNYSSGPTPSATRTQKREEPSRSGAAGGPSGRGLYPPHEAPARPASNLSTSAAAPKRQASQLTSSSQELARSSYESRLRVYVTSASISAPLQWRSPSCSCR